MHAPVPNPAADAAPAAWVVERVRKFDHTVGSVVPAGFEAYARVFHPAHDEEHAVRWSKVAAAYERTMHPAAEWGSLVGSWSSGGREGLWSSPPQTGILEPSVAAALAEVLGRHTTTPERCWFSVWEGWGEPALTSFSRVREGQGAAEREAELTRQAAYEQAAAAEQAAGRRVLESCAVFTLPNRPMWLLEGPIEAAACDAIPGVSGHSANVWWPDDHAWCVGSEIDLMSTYIGGSATCIEAILACEALEALQVNDRQLVSWDADEINPLPSPPSG